MSLESPALDVDSLLDDPRTRIIVCCGSGGVGKTTTAAALGVRAAERGRTAVVLTIDPARRLAQSMGLTELDNTPREVAGIDRSAGGSLHAMMLDMKRTFDEVVVQHSDPERARAILENPFYQSLSAGFAGTQEYMAMEKLGQLRAQDAWDLIIVDTPPSRSALDFLDAPKRLGSFLDGRFIKLLMAPAKVGGRAGVKFLNIGMSMMTGTLSKVMGAGLLRDVQTFVAAMDTMFGGFRTRADATFRLLQAPGTAFLVVAAPERDALREAAYFVERLAAEDMPLAGLVLNRVPGSGATRLSAERALAAAENLGLVAAENHDLLAAENAGPVAAENHDLEGAENLDEARIVDQGGGKAGLRNAPDTYDRSESPASEAPAPAAPDDPDQGSPAATDRTVTTDKTATANGNVAAHGTAADTGRTVEQLTAGLLRLHAERMQLLSREQRTRDRFTALHPEVAVAEVAALPGDVHDLAGLRDIGNRLAAGRPELPETSA